MLLSKSNPFTVFVVVFWTWVIISFVFCGCTVIPKNANAKKPSADGNEFNSGIITNMPDGSILVTQHFHDRNESMRGTYSNKFNPPLARDFGFSPYTNGTWLATKQAVTSFNKMNHWRLNPTP